MPGEEGLPRWPSDFYLSHDQCQWGPFLSFATITLDLEDQYGSKDIQDRFREDMLKVCTLGLQAGTVPEFLNQVTGKNPEFVTRTMLAMSLAYDLPYYLNCGGVTSTFYSMWKKPCAWGIFHR